MAFKCLAISAISDADGCSVVVWAASCCFIQADDLSYFQCFSVFSFTVHDSQTGADKFVSKTRRQSLRNQTRSNCGCAHAKSLWMWLLYVRKTADDRGRLFPDSRFSVFVSKVPLLLLNSREGLGVNLTRCPRDRWHRLVIKSKEMQ